MAKYSKIYRETGSTEKLFGYRYNYERSILEAVSKWDCDDHGNDIVKEEWEVYDSQGLSLDNWNDNPQYWVDVMAEQQHEECKYLI